MACGTMARLTRACSMPAKFRSSVKIACRSPCRLHPGGLHELPDDLLPGSRAVRQLAAG